MLKTIIQGRGTGKTTKAITLMEVFDDAILLTPKSTKGIYPPHISDRVYTIDGFLLNTSSVRGRSFNKVIIDEGFNYNPEKLAKLYYHLGAERLEVISIGSTDDTINF